MAKAIIQVTIDVLKLQHIYIGDLYLFKHQSYSKMEPENEPQTREQLREKLRSRVKNCKLGRASAAVREEKLEHIKSELDKILESTGISADQFINTMKKTGAPPKV
jgi:trimethylamine:corrinoid methyltransferase-like protein